MTLHQFVGSMEPAHALGMALIAVIVIFGVLGSVYENWR